MSSETRVTASTGGQKGSKDEQYHTIPVDALAELAKLYKFGAIKYADYNFHQGYPWSLSFNALMRHAFAWWGGKDIDDCPADAEGCAFDVELTGDPEKCITHSGLDHMASVAWHALTLLMFKLRHPELDDRVTGPAAEFRR